MLGRKLPPPPTSNGSRSTHGDFMSEVRHAMETAVQVTRSEFNSARTKSQRAEIDTSITNPVPQVHETLGSFVYGTSPIALLSPEGLKWLRRAIFSNETTRDHILSLTNNFYAICGLGSDDAYDSLVRILATGVSRDSGKQSIIPVELSQDMVTYDQAVDILKQNKIIVALLVLRTISLREALGGGD